MNQKIFALVASLLISTVTLPGQTPVPVVVPANVAPAAPTSQASPVKAGGSQALLQTLQQMKAANDETLRKQQATILQLDELQKAVEQIKIYSKRS